MFSSSHPWWTSDSTDTEPNSPAQRHISSVWQCWLLAVLTGVQFINPFADFSIIPAHYSCLVFLNQSEAWWISPQLNMETVWSWPHRFTSGPFFSWFTGSGIRLGDCWSPPHWWLNHCGRNACWLSKLNKCSGKNHRMLWSVTCSTSAMSSPDHTGSVMCLDFHNNAYNGQIWRAQLQSLGLLRLGHRKQRHPLGNKMRVVKEKGTKILNQCYFTGSEITSQWRGVGS